MRSLRRRGFTLIELMVAISIIALLTTIFFPHFWQARNRAHYSTCRTNLKNIATGLQSYANDNNLKFPQTLSAITPLSMVEIPTCPAAGGLDTYSAGYQPTTNGDTYTLQCKGAFHIVLPDVGINQPYYVEGLGLEPQQ
jgi:prepilin-type N-terminal cleavage/methylation domain-containing protein